MRKLTAKRAGFHGAHKATTETDAMPQPVTLLDHSANAATPTSNKPAQIGTIKMGYCWTHGLSKDFKHCSATCNNPKPGHQVTATVDNLMGGNNTIYSGKARHMNAPAIPNNDA